jgi:hypothetical protein
MQRRGASPEPPHVDPRVAISLGLAGILMGLVWLLTLRLGLNGDVQYVLGGLRTSEPQGVVSPLDIFTHRPLVYRVFLLGLDAVGATGTLNGESLIAYERTLRIAADLLVVLASGVLTLGLRRHLSTGPAVAAGLGVSAALAFGPPWDFLQPEWLATLCAVLGLGLMLWIPDVRLAAIGGGLFLAIAIWAKLATLPYALAAIVLLAIFGTRRASFGAVGTLVWAGLLSILTLVHPFEVGWLRDIRSLDLGEPFGTWRSFGIAATTLAGSLAVTPALQLMPASIVLLVRRAPSGRRLRLGLALASAALLLLGPMVVQGKGFLYHQAGLPVLAAGLVALALEGLLRTSWRAGLALTGMALVGGVVGLWLLGQPQAWRSTFAGAAMISLAVAAVILAVAAASLPILRGSRAPMATRWRPTALALLIGTLAMLSIPAVAPSSAWSLDPATTTATNLSRPRAVLALNQQLARIRGSIGKDAHVLYLAWGSILYHLGNTTNCRYPSPLFLRILGHRAKQPHSPSYWANVDCIRDPAEDWMVLQRDWMRVGRMRPELRDLIFSEFDCSRRLEAGQIWACPRRADVIGED